MTKKTISILGALFLLLLISATFPLWKTYAPFPKKISVTPDIFNFSSFSESAVEKLVIQKGADQKVFVKNGGDWFLNDTKAKFETVKEFFDGLQKTETKERVAKNPENHKDLGVAQENGYSVSISRSGGNVSTFIIGNRTPGETTYYARKEDSNDVYAVSGTALYKLFDSADQWTEKQKKEAKTEKKKPSVKQKKK